MSSTKIKASIYSGLKWNTLSVVATRSTDFVVKLILARLLLPESYGVIGMAMVIIGFLEVLSDMGLFNALVQKKEDELTETRYSTAFWILLLLATSFVLCFFFFVSSFGAAFYEEPQLVPVLNALSLYLFLSILSIIPRAILTKQLNFKSIVRITISGTVISSVIAIVLAATGFGVWSLVAKYMIGSLVACSLYWLKVNWRPRFIFDVKPLLQLAGYSTYTQINAILFYFRNHVDYLLVGKLLSAHMLGIYTLAFTLSETLRGQLYSIFNKVFFPVYSKIQDDKEQIKHYYLKVMSLAATVTFPVSVLLIGLAEEIILCLFDQKWLEAAEPLRILAVASMIFAISGTPAEVLKGIGKPSISFYLNTINTFLVALPLMYFGLKYYGLAGVAYAVCIQHTTSRLTFHHYMKKYIHVTDREVMLALKKPTLAAAVMLSAIYIVTRTGMPVLTTLIVSTVTGFLAYALFFINDIKQGVKLLSKANA